jgi:hypothetical protein
VSKARQAEGHSHLFARLGAEKQHLLEHTVEVRPMRVDHGIQVTLLLVQKVDQDLPRALDDLEMAVRLHLSYEVDHFGHDETDLVPLWFEVWTEGRKTMHVSPNKGSQIRRKGGPPGILKNVLAPPATRIHPLLSVDSMRFMRQRWLKILRYLIIDSGSSSVSNGASTLYSSVNTSHPISPWEYSSMRASKRRRASGGSFCAFEDRIAVSSVAVRLCR